MAFCTNCGTELAEGAKFCSECGIKIDGTTVSGESNHSTVYDGEIHKCPNCGEIIDSFVSICPSCGFELRGTKSNSAVVDFTHRLEKASTVKEKITIIKNFPIPNTKEALFEFLVLASANFDATYHAAHLHEEDISDAWLSKAEQCYQKAKLIFDNSEDLTKIKDIYDKMLADRDIHVQLELQRKEKKLKEKRKKDKAAKRNTLVLVLVGVLLFGGWLPLLGLIAIIWEPQLEAEELQRLENITIEVQEALNKEEYKHALRIADSIDYQRSDAEMERKWDIQREYWIDKVIEEAAEAGVILERPVDEEASSDEQTPTFDLTKENSIGSTQYGFEYRNYWEVKKELEERGFTNIKTVGLQDLKTDWGVSDGNVEKVTVDGETGFPADIAFPLDVEIVIYYHSYKN